MSGVMRGILVLSAVVVAGGCSHVMDRGDAAEAPAGAVVQVANNNWAEMTIYILRGGVRERLGAVTSFTRRTFRLPTHVTATAGEFRLLADPLGSSRAYTSPALVLGPGQVLEWRLENNLSLSTAQVR
jgi:hypothetical protein